MDKVSNVIKKSFQNSTVSTIVLIISAVVFLLLAPQIIFDSFLLRLKYYGLLLIPVAIFLFVTFLTYKGKLKESWSSIISCALLFVFIIHNIILIFSIVIDEIKHPITNIRYYEELRDKNFPEVIPKDAQNVMFYYHPTFLMGGSGVGLYFRTDNEELIQEYISKYEEKAKYTSLNYEPDRETGYLPNDYIYTPYEYEKLPQEFVIYYLEQGCDDSGYCNHGEYTIVAINDATNEVIFKNEDW